MTNPDNELITAAVNRRKQMYLQYQRLAQKVREIVEETAADSLIRCSVQHRIKSVDRLQKKLMVWRDQGKLDGRTTDAAILDRVGDISAVRVTTYLDLDRMRLGNRLKDRFSRCDMEVKDRKGSLYRAIHLQVELLDEDMEAQEDQALKGMSCEIQVCTLLSHVYSEIEHDLRYKPLSGKLSEDEQRLLDALGHLTLTGDQLILSLIERSEQRVREQSTTPNGDSAPAEALDIMTMLGPKLDFLAQPRDNAASVLRFLEALDLRTANAIEARLLGDDAPQRWAGIKAQVKAYSDQSNRLVGTKTVPYNPDTADGLLLLALGPMNKEIGEFLASRGPGRPPREVTLVGHLLEAMAQPSSQTAHLDLD